MNLTKEAMSALYRDPTNEDRMIVSVREDVFYSLWELDFSVLRSSVTLQIWPLIESLKASVADSLDEHHELIMDESADPSNYLHRLAQLTLDAERLSKLVAEYERIERLIYE